MALSVESSQIESWLRRMELQRRRLVAGVVARGVAGLMGMLLMPLIGFAIAIGMGYLLVVILIASTTQGQRDALVVILLLLLYAIYLSMVGMAFRSEYQTGIFLYESAQNKPPEEFLSQPRLVPFFYAPMGLDLLHDDAPVNILMRLPVYWARILARVAIQLKVDKSVKHFDPLPAARILAQLAARGEGIKTEELVPEGGTLASLHDPITYLIVLDMIGVGPAWSKIWLQSDIRTSVEAS
jgi:hypothetical protein